MKIYDELVFRLQNDKRRITSEMSLLKMIFRCCKRFDLKLNMFMVLYKWMTIHSTAAALEQTVYDLLFHG